MPDIDLKPDDYRERDPKTGLWKIKDDPRVQWFWTIAGIAILATIYFVRDQISSENVFWMAAIFGVVVGLAAYPILSRLDR